MTHWTPDDGHQVGQLYLGKVRGVRLGPVRHVKAKNADGPAFWARSIFVAAQGGGHFEIAINSDDRADLLTPEEKKADARARAGVRAAEEAC